MQLVNHWIDYKFRPIKTFNNHFNITHQFNGVELYHINESYFIYPISNIAVQLFHDGIYFPDIDLNLKCRIKKSNERLKIEFLIYDPKISKIVLKEIKNHLIDQLYYLEKRLNADPKINYVQTFCRDCIHEKTKPINICVRKCKFEAKKKKH